MSNLLLIARNEYLKKVGKKGFWIASLSIPVLIIIAIVVGILVTLKTNETSALGYIDQSGLIISEAWQPAPDSGKQIQILGYTDEAAAITALERKEIKGYYLIPADYLISHQLELYYKEDSPGQTQRDAFNAFLRASLASGSPESVRIRLEDGPKLTVQSMDGSKNISQGNVVGLLLPFVVGMILIITNMASASSLLQVVTDEKENRTIEVLLTSLSPEALIGGKVLGLMAVSFTQIAMLCAAIAIGAFVGGKYIPFLENFQIPWDFFLLVLVFFVPSYALVAGIMTAIGGSVTELTQGQQIAGVINMIFMLPLMLSALILFNPNSPVVVLFTLIPFTSFSALVLRWGFATIPTWELIVSWVLLVASAVFSIWASARIFRLGMLRFGSALDIRTALSSLWNRGS
ncbi:MAG: ABC transporter permease [Chloroflexi bacterium]|nr:MAG: ABC transporter permease [Chloroflexota bacterium]